MKKIVLLLPFLFFSCIGLSQTIGTIKTEDYKADFEKKQSLDVVSDYNGDIVIPIQILKIGINDEVYEMYPELKDKRVGLGVANIVLEYLESTDRFKFTEDKAEIKNKMIAQDKASDKGISSNKIEVKGNVTEDEVIKGSEGAKITQTTRLGLQIRFVDAQTGEVITGSGLGESNTVKTSSLLDDVDEIKFNQSTIGISTKKSLETASSRIVSKLIKKGVFKE